MARKLPYNDEEGGMAKAQLLKIETYAKKLNEMIHPDDELEAWVQSKLSVVAAYMGDVKHYLDYELKKYGFGGSVDGMNRYEVEFTWDKESEDEYDGRKVNVIAESVEEAAKKVTDKFSPYYKGFKIVEVELEKEQVHEEEFYDVVLKNDKEEEDDDDGLSFREVLDKTTFSEGLKESLIEDLKESGFEDFSELKGENAKETENNIIKRVFGFESGKNTYLQAAAIADVIHGKYAKGGELLINSFSDSDELNQLWRGYATAILFAETDLDTGESLEIDYAVKDFDAETVSESKNLLRKFYLENKDAIDESGLDLETIGNNIWYARAGHGAGFFDYNLDQEVEDKLTKGAKSLGEYPTVETYDGKISVRGGRVFNDYAKGGEVKLGLGQPVSYRGELYEVTQKDGVTHLTLNREGAWGSDYPTIPLSMVNQDELRNIHGQKVFIPYTFEKGGSISYVGKSIYLRSVPSPEFERFYEKEIVIEEVKGNKITKSFLRSTGEKVPFVIDSNFAFTDYAKGGKVKKKREWIQDALTGDEGVLRKTAKRKGLLKGDENLSMTDLKKLQKMGGKTAKRAYLAETLRSFEDGGTLNADAKVTIISPKNPLSKIVKTTDFDDLYNTEGLSVIKSNGEYYIILAYHYVANVDRYVIQDDLDYIKSKFGFDNIVWMDKSQQKFAMS